MKRFIVNTLIVTIAVGIGSYVLPGVSVGGLTDALIVAVVLGLLNNIVKPLLIILTIPITILTLGLFLLVINAGIILLADAIMGSGFEVAGFWWALLFSFLLSVLKSLMGYGDMKEEKSKG